MWCLGPHSTTIYQKIFFLLGLELKPREQFPKTYFGGATLRGQRTASETPGQAQCCTKQCINIYKRYIGAHNNQQKSIFEGAERQWSKWLSLELQAKCCTWNQGHHQSCKEWSMMQQSTNKSFLIQTKRFAWSQGRTHARNQSTEQSTTKLFLTTESHGQRLRAEREAKGHTQCNNSPTNHFQLPGPNGAEG